jgi:HEAT repeat protein
MGVIHQQPEVCVPLFVEGFSEPSLDLLPDCIEALGGFGQATSKYVDKIAEAYDNTNESVREAVCKTLWRVHDKDSVAVPVLIRGLQDRNPQVQESSALGLGRLAALPELAIPALEKSLQNPSSMCRWSSAQALGQFGPRAANSIPVLEKCCSDRDPMVRDAAANALRAIRQEPGTYFVEPDAN